jgi:hypothetical protein
MLALPKSIATSSFICNSDYCQISWHISVVEVCLHAVWIPAVKSLSIPLSYINFLMVSLSVRLTSANTSHQLSMDCLRLCWRLDLLLALQVSRNMRYNLKLLSFTRPCLEILNVRRQDLPRLFLMYATLVVRRIFASIYCRVCVCTLRLKSSFGRLTLFHFNLIVWLVQIKLLLSTHRRLQIFKMASYKLILV